MSPELEESIRRSYCQVHRTQQGVADIALLKIIDKPQEIGVSLFTRVSDLFATSNESNGSKPGHVAQGLGNRLSAITMDEFSV